MIIMYYNLEPALTWKIPYKNVKLLELYFEYVKLGEPKNTIPRLFLWYALCHVDGTPRHVDRAALA